MSNDKLIGLYCPDCSDHYTILLSDIKKFNIEYCCPYCGTELLCEYINEENEETKDNETQ